MDMDESTVLHSLDHPCRTRAGRLTRTRCSRQCSHAASAVDPSRRMARDRRSQHTLCH